MLRRIHHWIVLVVLATAFFVPRLVNAQAQGSAAALPTLAQITATVNTGGPRLRVRAGPGQAYAIVGRLVDGQRVPVLARTADGTWLLVVLPDDPYGPYGWIASAYVTLDTPLAQVPVAASIDGEGIVWEQLQPVVAPTQPGLFGKLAIPVFDTEHKVYNIWLVNADGTGLRRVMTDASAPALSYDGTMLAYRHWQVDDRGIVVSDVDGNSALRLTDSLEDVLPSFAPDRTKVVFSTYRWGDRKDRLYYAWTDEQNLKAWEWGAGGIYGEDPYWALDGRIFFRITRPERAVEQLWSMSGSDGTDQRLLHTAQSIRAPAVAPDSRTVVFMSFVGGNWDLFRIDTATGVVDRLTDDPANDGLPAFSPNGEYLAFVSDRGGRWGLWVMDAAGSEPALITTLPGPVDGRVEFEPEYLNKGWLEEQIAWSP